MASTNDISLEDGRKICKVAAAWKGTPYLLNGARAKKAVGGDCAGTTWAIYTEAGFAYEYSWAKGFVEYAVKTGRFREVSAEEAKQDGDILAWEGHLAVYCSFVDDPANAHTSRVNKNGAKWTQKNDMWTASHPNGPGYAPATIQYWRNDAPRWVRYVR